MSCSDGSTASSARRTCAHEAHELPAHRLRQRLEVEVDAVGAGFGHGLGDLAGERLASLGIAEQPFRGPLACRGPREALHGQDHADARGPRLRSDRREVIARPAGPPAGRLAIGVFPDEPPIAAGLHAEPGQRGQHLEVDRRGPRQLPVGQEAEDLPLGERCRCGTELGVGLCQRGRGQAQAADGKRDGQCDATEGGHVRRQYGCLALLALQHAPDGGHDLVVDAGGGDDRAAVAASCAGRW